MDQLGSYWTDLHEIWDLIIFQKSGEEIQVSLKLENNKCQDQYTFLSYVPHFFLE